MIEHLFTGEESKRLWAAYKADMPDWYRNGTSMTDPVFSEWFEEKFDRPVIISEDMDNFSMKTKITDDSDLLGIILKI